MIRVVGTAGHVDHGKSALVEALTGTHPDRLREEREREMTIDLGFAWMSLADGTEVGIVDVPGHRDFIDNMLAGAGGFQAAILVVAVDEGVMPQTREHLAILDLLQVPRLVVALTKIDVLDRIARMTERDGYLVLGAAETVVGLTNSFKLVADKRGLYTPNHDPPKSTSRLAVVAGRR